MNILWQGARGPAVKELQARLKELGFDPGDIDGIFGRSTTSAVTAFQRDRSFFADGIAGPQIFTQPGQARHSIVGMVPCFTGESG